MAKSDSSKKTGKGTRPRYEDPISAGEPVDSLPARSKQAAATTEVLEAVMAADGKWLPIDTGGRQSSSVQSILSSAANTAGLPIKVAVRGGDVYARKIPEGEDE